MMSSTPAVDVGTMTVRVASIQASSDFANPEANEAKFTKLIEEAAACGAKFIVLPETAITGYLSQDFETNWHIEGRPLQMQHSKGVDPAPYAEVCDGPMLHRFAELSKRLNLYITVPYLEKADVPDDHVDDEDDGDAADETRTPRQKRVYFNSVALVGPCGTILGNYRKMSPWPSPEQSWASKGREPVCVDTPYGRVGLAICFDIHSCLAKYARHNLWTLLYPIAWVGGVDEWFRNDLPQLLEQAKCPHYIIGCNWSTDEPQKWPGAGGSTHYGPGGEIVASTRAQTGTAILYSSILTAAGLAAVKAARNSYRPTGSENAIPDKLDLDKYSSWTNTVGRQAKEWKWD